MTVAKEFLLQGQCPSDQASPLTSPAKLQLHIILFWEYITSYINFMELLGTGHMYEDHYRYSVTMQYSLEQ